MPHAARRFGAYEVTLLSDGIFEAPSQLLLHTGGEEARQRLLRGWGGTGIRIDVNCFLLRGPDGVTLIDAGTGSAWGNALGRARGALAAGGVAPEQVDRVLLTHIHGDHALGLLDAGAAWLPRAEVLIPATDLAYFTDAAARAAAPEGKRSGFDIAAKLHGAYAGRIRAIPEGPVPGLPGIEAVPLPGHTPGHTGYLLHGTPDSLLIWADALHLWEAQSADPAIGLSFDIDPAQAARTRLALLSRAAETGWVVTGSHVPGFGHVRRAGDTFRIEAA